VVGKGFISLVTGLMSPMVKYQFQGTENIPQSGGFIAAANHASEFDALTFAEFLLMNGRQPRVLAKRSLFNTPVVGALMKATGMIPVDRGSDKAAASLDAAAQLLKEGECVALFPEGTLTRDPDLWPMEAKTGVARLAIASRAPVIPIGQWGAVNVLGRYSRVLKPFPRKTIKIAVGKPVDLSEFYGKDDDQVALRAATSKVMDAISALVSELRGQPAPMPRFDLHLHPEYKKKQHKYPPVTRP
jgi:1-acyl-sn-glycerol-3-phosphate acyltransferase